MKSKIGTAVVILAIVGLWEGGKYAKSHYDINNISSAVGAVGSMASDATSGIQAKWEGATSGQKLATGIGGGILAIAQLCSGVFCCMWMADEKGHGRKSGMLAAINQERKESGLSVGTIGFLAWSLPSILAISTVRNTWRAGSGLVRFQVVKPQKTQA